MAGIYWRVARNEQGDQRQLRPVQMEDGLVVALDRNVFEVAVPSLARIDAQFLRALA